MHAGVFCLGVQSLRSPGQNATSVQFVFSLIYDFIKRNIIDLQNSELWEGKGSTLNALWEGLGPNVAPISFPQWAKSKTSVFATDGIWVTFSVVLNFLLLGSTPWMSFQNERLMCFHNRQQRHGHSWTCCYSNTICKCDGRNQLFHFFHPSHFKDCVAIAMCLIVALFFPFLIEVCWLLYCVVYSLCKIT